MARTPVRKLHTELLNPVATPVDTYVQPRKSALHDFADSLAALDRPLREFIDKRATKFKEDEELRGEAAFYENNKDGLAEAVRTGQVPAQYSPAFVRGFKFAQGNVAGNGMEADFNAAFDAWDGKNSEDPEAFDKFFTEWMKGKVGTDDPDILRSLQPHLRAIHDEGTNRWITYRHEQTYNGSLDANVAAANQDIDAANADGLASPAGTDYPSVFTAIEKRREAFISSGGKPQDFDEKMINAMSAKILATRDPGLLAWFDQKVPGESYSYGDTPFGQGVKQNTIEALEVIARRSEVDDAQKQKLEDEAQKDAAHRTAIELLAKNPSAPLPDGLITNGRKYDPTFDVHVAEWRKALAEGFSDPEKVKAVYGRILDGDGFKAVTEAMNAGVFGRPEDLTAAYNFAKSYEDGKDRIDGVLGGSTAKTYLEAFDTRTKGKTDLGDPVSGMSNEGFEAQYDFKRAVQEWVLKNPNATVTETDEAVSKIGKSILDRITVSDPLSPDPGTYERAPDAPFDNPYTQGTAPIDNGGDQPQGDQTPDSKAELQDFLDGLDENQIKALDAQAKALGLTREQAAEKMLGTPPEPGTGSAAGAAAGALVKPISYQPGGEGGGITAEQASAFLDEAITASTDNSVEVGTSAEGSRSAGRLLDLIGKHEAAGNYNAVYGNAKSTRDLGQYTVNQLLAMQVAARRRGVASTALGKYQIIYKTMRKIKAGLGLSGNEKFTPELQDRMGLYLLRSRGLDRFLSGKMSKRAFALGLSQEWAALPNPETGRSYYAGDGLNASSVSTAKVYQALGIVQNAGFEPDTSAPSGNASLAYSKIPDVDASGQSGQQAKFMEWNPDPVGNEEQTLSTVDPDLSAVIRRAKEIAGGSFVVASGKRTAEQQAKAIEWGWSKKRDSDHLDGSAADLWPLDEDGAVVFDKKRQRAIVDAMRKASEELGIQLDIGADYHKKDWPHFGVKKRPTSA